MAPKTLKAQDISVILQGTLRKDQPGIAQRALHSIHDVLPDAQIIVSHPNHEDSQGLQASKFVTYVDPGPDLCFCGKSEMNLSRQILSMKTGLSAVDRTHVLKFRPEFELLGTEFLRVGTSKKIRVTNAFTHNPNRDLRYMHVSDIIQFGTFEKMYDFWFTEVSKRQIWSCDPSLIGKRNATSSGCSLMRPEQFLTLEYAKQVSNRDFSSLKPVNMSYSLYKECFSFLVDSFEVIPFKESQIHGPSRFSVVSEQSRYNTSWQSRNPSLTQWLLSFWYWIMSAEGLLISLRATIRKTIPSFEPALARILSCLRTAKRRLMTGAKKGVENRRAASRAPEPRDS